MKITFESGNIAQQIGTILGRVTNELRLLLASEMAQQSDFLTAYIVSRHLRGGTSSDRLAVRSGMLSKSTVAESTKIEGGKIFGGVRFGSKYAKVHVGPRGQSTVITAKPGHALAIPVGDALTPSGVIKRSSPLDYGNELTLIKRAGHAPILARVTGKAVYPMYVLKRSVTVPARVHPEDIMRATFPKIVEGFSRVIRAYTQSRAK